MTCDRLVRPQSTKFAAMDLDRVKLDGRFSGYASVFSKVDLGNDVILPGAFKDSLANRSPGSVRMLFQHNPDEPIGVWTKITEDPKGLWVEGRVTASTTKGAEILELLRIGAVDGLSIGFKTLKAKTDPVTKVRRILSADLWEISIVTFPMQEQARVSDIKGRSFLQDLPTVREFENWLTRDAGLTRSDARTVICKGFKHLQGMRDAARDPQTLLAEQMRLAAATLLQRNDQRS